jgi:DNA replication protein DnaC
MKHIMDLVHREPKTREDVCLTHGPYIAKCFFADVYTICPECQAETKRIEEEAVRAKKLEEDKHKWVLKVGSACIPDRFQDRSLKTFIADTDKKREALKFAVDYANNFDDALKTGRSAIFIGLPGTGKTHLAVGIALRIMHRDNRIVYFTTVRKAMNRVKGTWNKGSEETELEAIESLSMPDLLILDEIGVQFGSDTEKMILFDILNERYERRRPTILLSNLTIDMVKSYLGDRVIDRLREDDGQIIIFNWGSYRAANSKSAL